MLFLVFLIIVFPACLFTIRFNKLTAFGGLVGGLVALIIFSAFSFSGLALLGAFFIIATLATFWKKREKNLVYSQNDHFAKRDAFQVLANGGVAAIAALLAIVFPANNYMFLLMMAASLSSATADTVSSELGSIYGSAFYNILNFKKDQNGENGVVSIEGFIFGLAGSLFISAIFSIAFGWDKNFGIIIVSGTIGNLADSVLGATLERRGFLGNNQVNFLNTLIAAISVFLFLQ
ncbi:MAG: hypothetical protein JWQ25_2846 [Daejeonella sp.]|nr:hypothetical protein [Daejeonella sp.]